MADSSNSLATFDLILPKSHSRISLLSSLSSMSSHGSFSLSSGDTGAERRKQLRRGRRVTTASLKRKGSRWNATALTSTGGLSAPLSMPSRKRSNPNLMVSNEVDVDRVGPVIPERQRSNPSLFIEDAGMEGNGRSPQLRRQSLVSLAMPLRKNSHTSLMDISIAQNKADFVFDQQTDKPSTSTVMNATMAMQSLHTGSEIQKGATHTAYRFVEELISFPTSSSTSPTYMDSRAFFCDPSSARR